jgi:hypothetical protein
VMALALQNILSASPGPSVAVIVHKRKDAARKLSSCRDVDNNDDDNDGAIL